MISKKVLIIFPLLLLLLYAISCIGVSLSILRIICGFLLIAFIPGFSIYLLIKRSSLELLETISISMVISPIVVSVVVCLLMLSGTSWSLSIGICLAVCIGIILHFSFRRVKIEFRENVRIYVTIFSIAVFLAVAAAIFPITSEYYRMRSDAWHQAAMVYEIIARGVPPHEPIYEGQVTQYYWFYQLYVAILSKVLNLGPFEIMSILSAQFLFLSVLVIYLLSNIFNRNLYKNISAVLLTLIGGSSFGYLSWIPRCFFGEMRGWEEASRNISKINEGVGGTTFLVNFKGGIAWVLSKFMHSNPMVIAIVLFILLVYILLKFLSDNKLSLLILFFISLVGILLFHTISGVIFIIIFIPSAILLVFLKRWLHDFKSYRPIITLLIMIFIAILVTSPYLYSILWEREEVQNIQHGRGISGMLGNPFYRLAAIGASCMIIIPLAIPSIISLCRKGSLESVFYILMITLLILITLICPATYQVLRKLYYYAFIFLTIMGGWTIPILLKKYWTSNVKKLAVILLMIIVFLPTRSILLYGWITDPINTKNQRSRLMMLERGKKVYKWIRVNTPINAIFIENNNRTFILIFGQRRLFQNDPEFALAWRCDKQEIERRKYIVDNIYLSNDLEPGVREQLQAIKNQLYIVFRNEDYKEHSEVLDKLDKYPKMFERVYNDDESKIYKVIESSRAEKKILCMF